MEQILREVVPAGTDANCDGQRQTARDGESWILPQHPESEPDVCRGDHDAS